MVGLVLTTAALVSLIAGSITPHPIHSSSATLVLSERERTVSVVLRIFADDFPPGDAPAATRAYLAERFHLVDRAGRRITLTLEERRLEGAVLSLRLRGALSSGLSGARIWHGVLAERFADQVNIVQARYGPRSVSLLFTAGDGLKPLP